MKSIALKSIAAAILAATLFIACTKQQETDTGLTAARYLPNKIADGTIMRTGEIRTFVGDSLWEYIDGDAEIYHKYDFAEVATSDYKSDNDEFVADIYRFNNPLGAYGLYTVVRPPSPDTTPLGIQGFIDPSMVTFVKGNFVVRLIGFNSTEQVASDLLAIARKVDSLLPGTTSRPAELSLFPTDSLIPASDKVIGESFQGQAFLVNFFTQDYALGADTVTLFLADDSTGEKFQKWMRVVTPLPIEADNLKLLPFDNDHKFATDTYYGVVIGGLKGRYLAGIQNYNAAHSDFFIAWLNSLGK